MLIGRWSVTAVLAVLVFSSVQVTNAQIVTLTDGQAHNIGAGAPTTVDGLDETIFNAANTGLISNGNVTGNIENVITASGTLGPDDAQGILAGHLHYNNDAAVSSRAGALGASGFDAGNFTMLWTTTFTPDTTGAWNLRFNRVDDRASIWLDTSQNGTFESGERIYQRGCCGGSGTQTTAALVAGQTYEFGIVMNDTGGGGHFRDFEFQRPGSGTWVDLNPGANPGLFTVIAVPPGGFDDLVINGVGNTLTTDASLPSATIDTLTMNASGSSPNNSQLIVSPGSMGFPLEVTTSTTLNAATNTIVANNMSNVTLNNVTANGTFEVQGNGSVFLPTANTLNSNNVIVGDGSDTPTLSSSNNNALNSAGSVTVNDGGSLRITSGGGHTFSITLNGGGNVKSDGALHIQGSNPDVNGQITLGSNATIRKDGGGDVEFRGGGTIDLGNFELRMESANTSRNFKPIVGSASSTLRKEENGTHEIRANSPNFHGNIVINDGILDIDNRPTGLGSTTGDTTVNNGGTLRIRNGVTLAENIFINGNGHNNNDGAIRSENNSNTINGNVTLNDNARIHVNNTQLTLNGVLGQGGGNRNLEKMGGGTLVLTNTANSLAGSIAVSQGRLQAENTDSIASMSSISVAGGATLHAAGPGTVNTPVSLANGAALGNHQAGSSVTFSDVSTDIRSTVQFNGAGDTVISAPFGNGNTPIAQADSLAHFGYHINNDGVALDLNNNGGLMGGGDPFTGPNFHGLSFLTTGPGNRGLDFNNDGDFTATGSIGQNNNYSNLWVGTFTPDVSGLWGFRNAGDDDRAGVWFDINDNGIFESSTPGLGNNRGEQLSWENTGNDQVNLVAGQDYLIAFTHREGGGGSRADFRFTRPGGSEVIIKPGDPTQAGLFSSIPIQPENSIVKGGPGTTTLTGANTYNGTTSIQTGTLVAANDTALGVSDGTAAAGTTINSGATLALSGGIDVGNEHLTLGPKANIQNAGGINSIGTTSLAVVGDSASAADAVTFQSGNAGDVLTAGGGGTFDLGFSSLRVQGAGEVTLSQDISAQPLGSDTTVTTLGTLKAMRFTGGKPSSDLNFGSAGSFTVNGDSTISQGSLLLSNAPSQVADQTIAMNFDRNGDFTPGPGNGAFHWEAVFGDLGGNDQSNFQIAWTGQFSPDATGDFTFRSHDKDFTGGNVDDDASIFVDANQNGVFEGSEGFVSGSGAAITLTNLQAGEKYQIAIGYREGGGDEEVSFTFQGTAGAFTAETGINPGAANQNALFSLTTGSLGPTTYHAVKDGSGTLRLDGLIQFDGGVDVNDGVLIVNADNSAGGTPTGDWDVASGATLGGNGTISLAPGASVNVSGNPGIVSPGDGGPGYDNPANPAGQFSATYSHGTDMSTVGTLTFMAATSTDTALNLDGNLQLDIMGPNPGESDMLVASMGIIDIDESTAMLEINGQTDFSLLDLSSVLMGGDELILISATDGLLGQFANDAKDGDSFTDQSGLTFTFAQDDTTLSLIAGVPEPTTIAIWTILGLAGFGLACRQRLARKG